jgi:hypothetical protein
MRRATAFVLVCSLTIGPGCRQDAVDPNYRNAVDGIYQACTSAQTSAKGYCAGFMLGAFDEIAASNHLRFSPEGVSTEKIIHAFTEWRDAHREAWQERGSYGASAAFLAAGPVSLKGSHLH